MLVYDAIYTLAPSKIYIFIRWLPVGARIDEENSSVIASSMRGAFLLVRQLRVLWLMDSQR
jgi:hypothetical protein